MVIIGEELAIQESEEFGLKSGADVSISYEGVQE